MPASPPITKQLFAAGVQCAKRLYLDFHHPDRIPELPPDRQEMAETGKKLVSLARSAFPNGITVELNFPAEEAAGRQAPKLALTLGEDD